MRSTSYCSPRRLRRVCPQLVRFNPPPHANFACPLDSFRPRTAIVQIEYDALLNGFGLMISR
jgi:hypothetical protein